MVLNWSGDPVTPRDLIPSTYTPDREGSLQSELVSAARRRGHLAYPVSDLESLLQEISAGNPVVVLQNLAFWWYPVWHYAVVIGYDLPAQLVTLRSGTRHTRTIPLRLFLRTWRRSDSWGMTVVRPDRLPASAEEDDFLEAAIGLERAGQYGPAADAYAAALERWPGNVGAVIGLGNSLYALGDLEGAERAFRSAIELDPDAPAPLNNLAMVLAARGLREEALRAAKAAVKLGGPHATVYEETLREIDAGGSAEPLPASDR
jgi:tetratricopeptide (TPR) repeat protein